MSAPQSVVDAIATHRVECTGSGEVTCRACRERSWMTWREFHRHVADAAWKASLEAMAERLLAETS